MNDYTLGILVGRLTQDPELKYTSPGGIPKLDMTIAVRRKAKDEESAEEKTEEVFVEVTAWRRLAELCAQFLKKGRAIMVIGSLATTRTVRDGKTVARLSVKADRIQFLGPREAGAPEGARADASAEA